MASKKIKPHNVPPFGVICKNSRFNGDELKSKDHNVLLWYNRMTIQCYVYEQNDYFDLISWFSDNTI